jgi:enoyl-CoA hydratase/carnithine racemase
MIVESVLDGRGVRTITLNRPPANAIDHDMRHAVRDAFDAATANWDTKVVVLDSANPKFFSGGMDIKTSNPLDFETNAVPNYGSWMGREVFRAIYHCGAPVIAKVRGIAVGAGFLYAALADFTIAADTAQFGQYEIKVGAVGGTGILRRMMSEQAARYLTWTGALVSATDLVALGAGIRVVPAETLDEEVEALADMLAGRDQQLLRHMKLAMNQVEPLQPLEAYTFEQMHTAIMSRGSGAGGGPRLQPDHVRDLAHRAPGRTNEAVHERRT